MNIYVLQRFDYDYDDTRGLVVVAPSPQAARKLASAKASSLTEGMPAEFLNPELSSCQLVGQAAAKYKEPTVVLEDYLAG